MKCLIIVEYWSPSIAWLLAGLQELSSDELGEWTFVCTDSRWLRGNSDDVLSKENDLIRFENLIGAYGDLARGEFDCVLISETSEILWALPGYRDLPRVIIMDAGDSDFASSLYFQHPCVKLVLKVQYPSYGVYVGDNVALRRAYQNEVDMMIPWPYFGAQTSHRDKFSWQEPESDPKVFFHGWFSPPIRAQSVDALLKAGVPFEGGLHGRDEHPYIKWDHSQYDPRITASRIDRQEWLNNLTHCGLALDLPGNGQLTYRFVEALMLGCPVIAKSRQVVYHGRKAAQDEVCWYDTQEELIERSFTLLDNPKKRKELGEAGHRYYEKYLSPQSHARLFLKTIDQVARYDKCPKQHSNWCNVLAEKAQQQSDKSGCRINAGDACGGNTV